MLVSTLHGIYKWLFLFICYTETSHCFGCFRMRPLCQSSGVYSLYQNLFRSWRGQDTIIMMYVNHFKSLTTENTHTVLYV